MSDDRDSKPFRIKTRLGISGHYAEDAVVVVPPALARRVEDARLDVQGDLRAFTASDQGLACWLKLGTPAAVAGQLASDGRDSRRLTLVEFRSVKDVTVTLATGGVHVSQRIDSDDLQRWDPRGLGVSVSLPFHCLPTLTFHAHPAHNLTRPTLTFYLTDANERPADMESV